MSGELERRRDKRIPQSGSIEITIENPTPVTIQAELIEVSEKGFRASHDFEPLVPGLEVRYKLDASSGRARVMWLRVLEGRCISGFLILPA